MVISNHLLLKNNGATEIPRNTEEHRAIVNREKFCGKHRVYDALGHLRLCSETKRTTRQNERRWQTEITCLVNGDILMQMPVTLQSIHSYRRYKRIRHHFSGFVWLF